MFYPNNRGKIPDEGTIQLSLYILIRAGILRFALMNVLSVNGSAERFRRSLHFLSRYFYFSRKDNVAFSFWRVFGEISLKDIKRHKTWLWQRRRVLARVAKIIRDVRKFVWFKTRVSSSHARAISRVRRSASFVRALSPESFLLHWITIIQAQRGCSQGELGVLKLNWRGQRIVATS